MKSLRTRWAFTIVFAFLCLLSISLPYKYEGFFHSENERLTIIVILITGFAAMLTFLIAVLLYEKFGIERILQERTTLMVIDILNFLKSNTILVHTSSAMFPIQLFNPFPTYAADYQSVKIIVPVSFFDALEPLQQCGNSIVMDQNIATKVQKLKMPVLSMAPDANVENGYAEIRLIGTPIREGERFGAWFEKDMTLKDLMDLINDLKVTAIAWLRANCKTNFDFNL